MTGHGERVGLVGLERFEDEGSGGRHERRNGDDVISILKAVLDFVIGDVTVTHPVLVSPGNEPV